MIDWGKVETVASKLKQAKETKRSELRAEGERRLGLMRAQYWGPEVESWEKQVDGMKKLRADPNSTDSNAVFVKGMAQGRGWELNQMLERIEANDKAASGPLGVLIGMLQGLEDKLNHIEIPDNSTVDNEAQIKAAFDAIQWIPLETMMAAMQPKPEPASE